MSTIKNIEEAFSGESQANRRYHAFAIQADKDGFPQIAKLFRAAAEAETIHALAHLKAMDGIQSTEENLKVAAEGERYEFQEMYPQFLTTAQQEGQKRAEINFKQAGAAEEVHYNLYKLALQAVQAGQDLESLSIYVCPVCGNIEIGTRSERCPICNAPADKYFEVK
ncbi:MAG: rubrerythrin family protein [bacterium]|jgi:rubrerythrin